MVKEIEEEGEGEGSRGKRAGQFVLEGLRTACGQRAAKHDT